LTLAPQWLRDDSDVWTRHRNGRIPLDPLPPEVLLTSARPESPLSRQLLALLQDAVSRTPRPDHSPAPSLFRRGAHDTAL